MHRKLKPLENIVSELDTTRFAFVLPFESDSAIDELHGTDCDRDWQRFNSGRNAWVLQSFCRLHAYLPNALLTNKLVADAVNLIHGADSRKVTWPSNMFVVNLRADYPANRLADIEIVQNKKQCGKRNWYVTHWPQANLIPRAPSRGERLESIGYFGRHVNHYSRWFRRASGWCTVGRVVEQEAEKAGFSLVVKPEQAWNDFSEIDAALAVRSMSRVNYKTKPPTKLINASLAGTVFIGGGDCAFSQVATPSLDYARVRSRRELREALESLKNPLVIEKYRRGSALIASRLNHETITKEWLRLLVGAVLAKRRMKKV